jgi:hypothetical protein
MPLLPGSKSIILRSLRTVKPLVLFIGEHRFRGIRIMHRLNATGGLFPTPAIRAGVEMAYQAIQHIDDPLGKHHSPALLALSHCLLQSSQELAGSWYAWSIFAAKMKSLSVSPLIL